MGSLTFGIATLAGIGGIALLVLAVATLASVWIGYEMGIKHTEERWDNAVTRAGVKTVRRCGICGFNRGDGID